MCIESQIWDASSACMCCGDFVCIFTPKITCLLFPPSLRGRRFADKALDDTGNTDEDDPSDTRNHQNEQQECVE